MSFPSVAFGDRGGMTNGHRHYAVEQTVQSDNAVGEGDTRTGSQIARPRRIKSTGQVENWSDAARALLYLLCILFVHGSAANA